MPSSSPTKDPIDRNHARPKHLELWGHLVLVNRSLVRMLFASALITVAALALMSWAVTKALHAPLVYYVDSTGRAAFGGTIAERAMPQEVEVAYVAKEFLRRSLGLSSLTVEQDLAAAFNLMTGEMQDAEDQRFTEWAKERGHAFVDYVRLAQIRTTVEFRDLSIQQHAGGHFSVRLDGQLTTWPLRRGESADARIKVFESQLSIVSVPRSEEIPNGLLVSHHSIQYRAPADAADTLQRAKGLDGTGDLP